MPDCGVVSSVKKLLVVFVAILALPLALSAAPKPLQIYFIDVEGGQSTLFVSPSGQSMLIDTGWPDNNGRDADRIVSAARNAGLSRIDYVLLTHYHDDHAGGVPQLVQRIPVGTFIDHGANTETREGDPTQKIWQAYQKVLATGRYKHIVVHAGDVLPVPGIKVIVLTAAGREIDHSLPGGGEPNTYCPATSQQARDHSENAESVGVLVSYGKFRMIDLGDLPSWPGEHDLVCPANKVGQVEVYLSTQHAYAESGAAFLVDALRPIVAIANNSQHKGGTPKAFEVIDQSPGLEAFWDLHYSDSADKSVNARPAFIANLTDNPGHGYWIRLAAHADGAFTVTNQRNGETKTYQPRK